MKFLSLQTIISRLAVIGSWKALAAGRSNDVGGLAHGDVATVESEKTIQKA